MNNNKSYNHILHQSILALLITLISSNPIVTLVSHITTMDDQEINIDSEEENDPSNEEKETDSEEDEKTISFLNSKKNNPHSEKELKKQWAHFHLIHQKVDLEAPFVPPKL